MLSSFSRFYPFLFFPSDLLAVFLHPSPSFFTLFFYRCLTSFSYLSTSFLCFIFYPFYPSHPQHFLLFFLTPSFFFFLFPLYFFISLPSFHLLHFLPFHSIFSFFFFPVRHFSYSSSFMHIFFTHRPFLWECGILMLVVFLSATHTKLFDMLFFFQKVCFECFRIN